MLEAIVLAGGFGTRLQSVVPDIPKPMAPVGGRPFLEILLKELAHKGFGRVILSLGYMADQISAHFGEEFCGIRLAYTVEVSPLGTGGAVRLAMSELSSDHIYVFNGDTYINLEVNAVERLWQEHRRPVIVGCHVEDVSRYGRLIADGQRIVGFTEKGDAGPGLINAGCYVLNRGQLDSFPIGTAFSLEQDYFSKEVKKQHFDLFATAGHFIDIGVPEDYAKAQIEFARQN